jgi:hypothetical protein
MGVKNEPAGADHISIDKVTLVASDPVAAVKAKRF